MLCVNRLAARNVVRSATLPSAIAVDTFVDGEVETAEFAVDADAPIAGGTIAEADRFASLTFAGILRDEDVIVPDLPVPAVPVLPTPDAPKPGDVTQRPGTGPREPR